MIYRGVSIPNHYEYLSGFIKILQYVDNSDILCNYTTHIASFELLHKTQNITSKSSPSIWFCSTVYTLKTTLPKHDSCKHLERIMLDPNSSNKDPT